jgi:DUF4097 and DUF4098 domain-containing protein YvlB
MRAKLLLMPLGVALLGLTACDIEDFGSFQRYQRDFHYSYPLKRGGSVSVEGFNGSVEISGWDQDAVDVSGTAYGPTQEAANALKIDVQNGPDEVSIRAVRPSDRRNNQGARFTIKIPRTAVLERITTSNGPIRTLDGKGPARMRTSNGMIRVQDLAGNVEATTSNASVELVNVDGDASVHSSNGHIRAERLGGSLEASTSNASITATVGESNRPVRLETSNGSVDLSLPPHFASDVHVSSNNAPITLHIPDQPNARLIAHTSNSSITTDYEIRMQGGVSKNQVEGTLGSGGGLIDLGTSNGSIRLLRM